MKRSPLALGLALAVTLGLGACGAPGGGSGGSGGGEGPTLTIDDLRGIVHEGDGLESLEFEATEVSTTASEDAQSMSDYWDESDGQPAECFDSFSAPYLLNGTEDGDGGDDDTMEIAVFTATADDDLGLVLVNGRIFDSPAEASGFVDGLQAGVDACPDGYSLSSDGEVTYENLGSELGELDGVPGDVRTVTVTEDVLGGGDALSTTYLLRGNAVVAIYAEAYAGSSFVIGDVDPVAVAAAERLAAL